MNRQSTVPLWVSTLAVGVLTLGWAYIRLVLFEDLALPLTFVVPMLVCVWTRRPWQLWGMAAVFIASAAVKVLLLPPGVLTPYAAKAFLITTVFNIMAGGAVIHAIIRLRERLDERHAQLLLKNAALETQGREMAQQNEEIRVQAEELAQQNEEIEAQSEELAGQNEELQETAERLSHREAMLQTLLESTRTPEGGRHALAGLARRALSVMGPPAECLAIYKLDGPGLLRIKVQAAVDGGPSTPDVWLVDGSIASVVMAQDKTAYLSDLQGEPALAAPFGTEGAVRSVLATPMHEGGMVYGMVIACSSRPGHWTQEQFRVLEWVAGESGLIAESLRWQTKLADRAREIEAANRAKDQFLAMLSHELRTPLTPVLAASGVLEHDRRLPDDVRGDLAMIRRNIAIQSRLIDDLLDLTKIGRGKLELETQPLELGPLLKETAAIVGPELDAKSQTLVLEISAAADRTVRGDRPRLQQVFWNLLKNASKFSPPHTRIHVAVRPPATDGADGRIEIDVTDQGIGLDPTDAERIFLPFEQVATREKLRPGDGGLGLGLAIAKALVELHGGRIRATSNGRNLGSTFTVELPLAPGTDRATRPAARPGDVTQRTDGAANALRILLVEDHADTGRVLARLLRNAGYVVEHAATAADATSRFTRGTFDVLVSDLGLPDESGIDLMRRLRTMQPELVGICLSGYGMENDVEACREAGFAEHLTKPVDMHRLHAAIARHGARLLALR